MPDHETRDVAGAARHARHDEPPPDTDRPTRAELADDDRTPHPRTIRRDGWTYPADELDVDEHERDRIDRELDREERQR